MYTCVVQGSKVVHVLYKGVGLYTVVLYKGSEVVHELYKGVGLYTVVLYKGSEVVRTCIVQESGVVHHCAVQRE